MTFVDTSALYAMLVANDRHHARAAEAWREMIERDERMLTSNYVVVEVCSLLHSRLGVQAVRTFVHDVLPVLAVVWVDQTTHQRALAGLCASGRAGPSLVDRVSFLVAREVGADRAFAFDPHFADEGLAVVGD